LKKQLKKQIKSDEFVTTLQRIAIFAAERSGELKILGVVVALLVVGGLALDSWLETRRREASRAFAEAVELFHAPVISELPEGAELPVGPSFASRDDKYSKALAAFDGFERRHPRSDQATSAAFYGALCRIELGELDRAEELMRQIAADKQGEALEPALALLALARVQRLKGETDEAVETYRRLLDDEQAVLPRDEALMGMAAAFEEGNRLGEARAAYEQLTERFPTSVYATDARTRAAYLELSG
jgi:tetratricopeptide (TPR) repeat protein